MRQIVRSKHKLRSKITPKNHENMHTNKHMTGQISDIEIAVDFYTMYSLYVYKPN